MREVLDDRQALRDLLATYAACIDDRDFKRYRECFEPNVELPGFGPEPIVGIDAWIEFVHKALEPFRATQHLLGAQLAEVDGDHARMRTDLQASHFFIEPEADVFTLWGFYESEARRRGGRWRLARHALVVRATKRT